MTGATDAPIVFVGPSLSHGEAAQILCASYCPPIRRGDLEDIPDRAVVAIIDGVFDQQLAVSPSEIRHALSRGIRVFGASSMGALRAAEIPGVVGVGRVYEMYRRATIDSDDEVAITFDPETLVALCVPLVNIRYSLERLAGPGTISRDLAGSILRAARRLPYWDRLYPRILVQAGISDRTDAPQLARMLANYDLKREDAITLLEQLRGLDAPRASARSRSEPATHAPKIIGGEAVHLWELGPPLPFRELLIVLACTGALGAHAVRALATVERRGHGVDEADLEHGPSVDELRALLLARTARTWSWVTEEEVNTSLAHLGVTHDGLEAELDDCAQSLRRAMAHCRSNAPSFFEALRAQLFLDDLELKRVGARTASIEWLSSRGRAAGALRGDEQAIAIEMFCRWLDAPNEAAARRTAAWWGIAREEVDRFVEQIAFARRTTASRTSVRAPKRIPLVGRRSPKVGGSRRFCSSLKEALAITRRLARTVGVTRIAMITGLGDLGIPNAQAFRPDGEWSSTVGSGKSETNAGARIGAVMEEVEKWAQERYAGHRVPDERYASFHALARRDDVVDPASLDLPYDSCYRPDLVIAWRSCTDLVSGRAAWVPAAALTHLRVSDDIYYSPHGGRKTVTTNGLAAGFTMAEALTHALCELVERHARTCAAVIDGNPGAPYASPRAMLDLTTTPISSRRLVGKIERPGHRVRVWDLTSDVELPTFAATILLRDAMATPTLYGDGWRRAGGWACHPDPETAVNMALLEASQTVMTNIAGAREDLTLHARSLGRHERTESCRSVVYQLEHDPQVPRRSFDAISGFGSSDAATDVRWIVERICAAGYSQILVANYSRPELRPARVVRAIIPGFETINPFYTGALPRLALVEDLLGSIR